MVTPTFPLLSLREASEVLQVSVETLGEHIAKGRLPVQDDSGAWPSP
jgi:predicted site-specific integrase-resolvase